jgi:hypothetical protein
MLKERYVYIDWNITQCIHARSMYTWYPINMYTFVCQLKINRIWEEGTKIAEFFPPSFLQFADICITRPTSSVNDAGFIPFLRL